MDLALLVVVAASLLACGLAGTVFGIRRERRSAQRRARPLIRRLENQAADARSEAGVATDVLEATFSAVGEGLILIDAHEKIVAFNPSAATWFDLDGSTSVSLMAGVGSAELRAAVEAGLSGEMAAGGKALVRIDDRVYGTRVHALQSGGAVISLRDDTEMRRLVRARRDLVANVSHDLRTPLTSLILLVESLLSEPQTSESDSLRRIAGQIRDLVGVLQTSTDMLVELSRLESGRTLFRLQTVRLADLVATATDGLAPLLRESRVKVAVEVPDDLTVLADAPQIIRALTNLLDNARRHSPMGGTVRVGAGDGSEPDRIEVSVRDDGPGIAPTEAGRVFERFYRGDPARSGSGTGLGLAITRFIIEGHGGVIWVDTSVTAGATLRFTLPRGD